MPTNTLTVKQSRFVAEFLKDGKASRAYRDSYDAANMSDGAIRVEACRLLQRPNVAQRIEEARQCMAKKAQITLARLRQLAPRFPQFEGILPDPARCKFLIGK